MCCRAIAGFDARDAGSLQASPSLITGALQQDLHGLRLGVLRHNWEEDMPASDDVRQAMDRSAAGVAKLGADLEECRIAVAADYFDVKVIIAETEIFSIHQPNLMTPPG